MEITNVKCLHCGKKGYNPNVPVGHVIDTCNSEVCLSESHGVIGFKDGVTFNCSVDNLYRVHPEVYFRPMIDSTKVNPEQVETNHIIARMMYCNTMRDYSGLQSLIDLPEVSDTPEADYYRSKIFFKKLFNQAKGVKHLRLAAEEVYPPAMAEYGYIITKGMYGTAQNANTGLEYLVDAVEANEPKASAYLADIYKEGLYKGTKYNDISNDDWYRYISLGELTHDSMVHMVLGYFHHAGIGCSIDQEIALTHYRVAAQDGYVLAMGFIVEVLFGYYDYQNDKSIRTEILRYAGEYLETAAFKEEPSYLSIKSIYESILSL